MATAGITLAQVKALAAAAFIDADRSEILGSAFEKIEENKVEKANQEPQVSVSGTPVRSLGRTSTQSIMSTPEKTCDRTGNRSWVHEVSNVKDQNMEASQSNAQESSPVQVDAVKIPVPADDSDDSEKPSSIIMLMTSLKRAAITSWKAVRKQTLKKEQAALRIQRMFRITRILKHPQVQQGLIEVPLLPLQEVLPEEPDDELEEAIALRCHIHHATRNESEYVNLQESKESSLDSQKEQAACRIQRMFRSMWMMKKPQVQEEQAPQRIQNDPREAHLVKEQAAVHSVFDGVEELIRAALRIQRMFRATRVLKHSQIQHHIEASLLQESKESSLDSQKEQAALMIKWACYNKKEQAALQIQKMFRSMWMLKMVKKPQLQEEKATQQRIQNDPQNDPLLPDVNLQESEASFNLQESEESFNLQVSEASSLDSQKEQAWTWTSFNTVVPLLPDVNLQESEASSNLQESEASSLDSQKEQAALQIQRMFRFMWTSKKPQVQEEKSTQQRIQNDSLEVQTVKQEQAVLRIQRMFRATRFLKNPQMQQDIEAQFLQDDNSQKSEDSEEGGTSEDEEQESEKSWLEDEGIKFEDGINLKLGLVLTIMFVLNCLWAPVLPKMQEMAVANFARDVEACASLRTPSTVLAAKAFATMVCEEEASPDDFAFDVEACTSGPTPATVQSAKAMACILCEADGDDSKDDSQLPWLANVFHNLLVTFGTIL